MAILNIKQFLERVDVPIKLCNTCYGKMNEMPITQFDALKLIFGKRKIIKRYKCIDCGTEVKTEN